MLTRWHGTFYKERLWYYKGYLQSHILRHKRQGIQKTNDRYGQFLNQKRKRQMRVRFAPTA